MVSLCTVYTLGGKMEGERAAHKPWSEAEPLLQPLSQMPVLRLQLLCTGAGVGRERGRQYRFFLDLHDTDLTAKGLLKQLF